ncbi:MAG: LOG family protein [Nocardioidaceae bacterium]
MSANTPGPAPRRGRPVEVESLAQFDALVAGGAGSIRGWRLQGVDLTDRSEVLAGLRPAGAIFLGCRLGPGVGERMRAGGALVFPAIPDVPFDPYRSALYDAGELYDGVATQPYEDTTDALVYAWTRRTDTERELHATLATALHDHAISDALEETLRDGALAGRDVIGVMGGHDVGRTDRAFGDAAYLARRLARAGLLVATGGGPGAMEAANLGAYLADIDEDDLDKALRRLADVASFVPSVTDWARAAVDVLADHPAGTANLGIPTWFYGHEPPNLFATHVAKYFANPVREARLLRVCTAGIVFLPGAAGTVQEIFQDACENYYAPDGAVAPMVLVGRAHWDEQVPAWPLLRSLGAGRAMGERIWCVETVEEAYELVATGR